MTHTRVCEFKVNMHTHTHTHAHELKSKYMQLTADKCLRVFHISSAAKQAIAEETAEGSVCV